MGCLGSLTPLAGNDFRLLLHGRYGFCAFVDHHSRDFGKYQYTVRKYPPKLA
jgi:hypothetical protein